MRNYRKKALNTIYCPLQIENNNLEAIPIFELEGESINIGSQLVLTDVDSANSIVNISRVLVEVVNGSPAEMLSFATADDGDSGFFGEGSGGDMDGLLQPMRNTSESSVHLRRASSGCLCSIVDISQDSASHD